MAVIQKHIKSEYEQNIYDMEINKFRNKFFNISNTYILSFNINKNI